MSAYLLYLHIVDIINMRKFFTSIRYYIDYKLMKKKVKQYAQQLEHSDDKRQYILSDFSRILDKQVSEIIFDNI